MNNIDLTLDSSSGKKTIKLTLNIDNVDFIALKTLVNDCPKQLIPLTYYELNNKIIIEYDCLNLLDFKYLSKKLALDVYITILKDLILFSHECADWFLNNNLINYNVNYIFYSKEDVQLKYIYVPIKKAEEQVDSLKDLITHFIKDFRVENGEKLQYELLRKIIEPSFIIDDISEIISNFYQEKHNSTLNEETILKPAKKEIPSTQQNIIIDVAKQEDELVITQNNTINTDNLFEVLKNNTGEDITNKKVKAKHKKGFFKSLFHISKNKKVKKQEINVGQEQIEINNFKNTMIETEQFINNNNKTVIINQDHNSTKYFLKLEGFHENNVPYEINISTANAFTIGREDNQSIASGYLFSSDIKSISRIHAQFELINKQLQIVDLQSANGTYVNNVKITANIPHKINKDDIIKFSNKIAYRVCLRK
ncbi:FHA domain-containing protein [Clostridium sp. 'deep sea']|uniref:FHA domain-containing protein n=1 Tax=Clostridium sp. 'deep sea' TaxID=2779445 RepID=UPI001896841E|nr:FHA domain-containing protein [Clostridium sp. 'deep sea']QOR33659.1 FHA domain-containing protein [Clostridium sp. 'deep sea']